MKAIMEENGVPLLPEVGEGNDKDSDKDKEGEKTERDVEMVNTPQREESGDREAGDRRTKQEEVIVPVKRERVSRFDDTIGLHLKDRARRERTQDGADSSPTLTGVAASV